MRKLSAKWVPKCLNADQKRQRCQSSVQLWSFSARSKLFPVAIGDHGRNLFISLWLGDKATVNKWRHSGSPRPKKFRVQKSAGKVLASFFTIKTAPSSLITFQRAKLSTRSITHVCWCKWRTFWRKNAAGKSPRGSCSCTIMPRHHRAVAIQKKLTYLGFQCLDHPPYSPALAPSLYHLFPGLKRQLKCRPSSSDVEVIAAAETWLGGQFSEFFLSGLQNLEQGVKKCIELRGEYVEQIPSLVAVACFLPGRAKDLSVHPRRSVQAASVLDKVTPGQVFLFPRGLLCH